MDVPGELPCSFAVHANNSVFIGEIISECSTAILRTTDNFAQAAVSQSIATMPRFSVIAITGN